MLRRRGENSNDVSGNRTNSSLIDDRGVRVSIFVFSSLKFTMDVHPKGRILDCTNDGKLHERFLEWKKKV